MGNYSFSNKRKFKNVSVSTDTIVNLTGHPISVYREDGDIVTYPPVAGEPQEFTGKYYIVMTVIGGDAPATIKEISGKPGLLYAYYTGIGRNQRELYHLYAVNGEENQRIQVIPSKNLIVKRKVI